MGFDTIEINLVYALMRLQELLKKMQLKVAHPKS